MVRSVMGRAYRPERRKKQKGKAFQSALTNRKAFTLEPINMEKHALHQLSSNIRAASPLRNQKINRGPSVSR